ncbi:hypothetical protein B005_1409 [Nocardiopsis alba ATCC BAA-2165]|uniref:Uncharacterized protein n=1 Tax=Nocardiopsis alba (strain ATCC BAA-2165 / BE74) TaxID=1205910 RepID=J7L2L4_NOCAA|nr:hypothetical protein B005_1409 [Nocardiopsis alba ATCC BAA-2165]
MGPSGCGRTARSEFCPNSVMVGPAVQPLPTASSALVATFATIPRFKADFNEMAGDQVARFRSDTGRLPPRTRGWALGELRRDDDPYLFPAHAGMDPRR